MFTSDFFKFFLFSSILAMPYGMGELCFMPKEQVSRMHSRGCNELCEQANGIGSGSFKSNHFATSVSNKRGEI